MISIDNGSTEMRSKKNDKSQITNQILQAKNCQKNTIMCGFLPTPQKYQVSS